VKERYLDTTIERNNENIAELDAIVKTSSEKSRAIDAETLKAIND
jgi:hypothetical protein